MLAVAGFDPLAAAEASAVAEWDADTSTAACQNPTLAEELHDTALFFRL